MINIEQLPNETDLDYHKRIIFGKLVDKTLSDRDYTELAEKIWGQSYSSDVARRMFYGARRELELMDSANTNNNSCGMDDYDQKMIELQKEQQKFRDQRSAFNKIVRDRARQEELNDILVQTISEATNFPTLHYVENDVGPSDNDLLVSLNDIHYGLVVSNAWSEYNPDVCEQMMCKYLHKIIDIAKLHHSENCYIYENGDSISGNIHLTIQIANKENVVQQVQGVSELIAEFISVLSKHFKKVIFVSVAGNHSRLNTKDNSPIDERMDDLVAWYLKARLQNFDNVVIGGEEKIDPTMYLLDIRGKTYCGVHGDFENSPAKIAALQMMAQKPLYAIISGHYHHNKMDEVQGVKTIMAGSFVGVDDFCISKRIYGHPEQLVCVCDSNGIVCHYDIPL